MRKDKCSASTSEPAEFYVRWCHLCLHKFWYRRGGGALVGLYNTFKSDLSNFITVCIYCELNVGLCTKYQYIHVQFIH